MRPEIEWKSIDYDTTYRYRVHLLTELNSHPESVESLFNYYKEHWAYFIEDWMVTVDQRKVNVDAETTVPFRLFPRQREFVDWVYQRFTSRERGLAEKSRDVGLSAVVGF
jgi:phage terminase large subunit